jgi:hypothetical protein
MVIGFWTSSRAAQVPRLCPRHGNMLEALDQQEAIRVETDMAARAIGPSKEHQAQLEAIRARADAMFREATLPKSPMMAAPVQPTAPAQEFALGPGPLLNGNSVPPNLPIIAPAVPMEPQASPPVPNAEPPKAANPTLGSYACGSCTFRGMKPDDLIEHIKRAHPGPGEITLGVQPPDPTVGTVQGALEAAKAPPTPGAKVSFPCPTCQKPVMTGETHACSG